MYLGAMEGEGFNYQSMPILLPGYPLTYPYQCPCQI